MRLSIHLPQARRARVVLGGVAAAGMIASAVGATAPASAAGLNLIASTTTLAGTLSENGLTLTLNSSVSLGGKPGTLNLGNITPGGSVIYTDNAGDTLGSTPIPSCILKACNMAINVPVASISDGTTKIFANYGGDSLLKPSSASIAFGKSGCNFGDCDFVISSGSTTLEVDSHNADTDDPAWVDGSLGGPALPCSIGSGAVVANFDGHNLTDRKDIMYDLTGPAATAYNNASDFGDGGYWDTFCWVSPNPFFGYNPGSTNFNGPNWNFTNYTQLQISGGPYNGDYVGLLAPCDDPNHLSEDPSGPCISDYEFDPANVDQPQDELYIEVDAPAGDPHAGG